jgi:hypothetical protein
VECKRRAQSVTIVERRAPWSPDIGPEWTEQKIAHAARCGGALVGVLGGP